MIPTRALREKAMQLLAADTATLAQAADENVLILFTNEAVPGESLLMAGLDEATFDGYAAIDCALGAQAEGLDPANNDSIITIEPAAGLFRFETTGLTDLPQTIHGYALCNAAKTTLFAAELFDEPFTLTGTNQVINVPPVTLRQAADSIQ